CTHTRLVHGTRPHSRAAPPPCRERSSLFHLCFPVRAHFRHRSPGRGEAFPACRRRAPSSLFPAGDGQRESTGWAGSSCRSGSRTVPARAHLCLPLDFPLRGKPRPRLGDLTGVSHFGYERWVVYVGDGYAVHLAPLGKDMLPLPFFLFLPGEPAGSPASWWWRKVVKRCSGRAPVQGLARCPTNLSFLLDNVELSKCGHLPGPIPSVCKCCCWNDVVGRDRYHVNNKHDDKYSPLPPSKIVQRAEQLVGQELPYSLPCENCEHFANELRYGVARSDQIPDAVKTIQAALLAATVFVRILWARSKRKKQ
ncbi:phospholipase A and acyltransferase 2-like, partial [Acinonyx jubatus]|uniref:Phospholipase A and acyltransferase 2-like n=1 Tax=Acinonyx jubatus TaxID=32536 RepID=A0ABM3NGT4_ACIJB